MPTSARQPPGSGQSVDRTVPHPRRRGGFYIRPEPGTSSTGPMYIAPAFGRALTGCAFADGAFVVDTERADVGIGPYGARSAMVHPTRRGTRGTRITNRRCGLQLVRSACLFFSKHIPPQIWPLRPLHHPAFGNITRCLLVR